MRDAYKRVCYILASANFKEKELADFAMELKESGAARFVDDVMKKRSVIARDDQDSPREADYSDSRARISDDSFSAKVTQLLVHEAGMTRLQASEELRAEIESKNLPPPPTLGRRSFREWLDQLSRSLSPSEILHISTRIRNRHVNQSDTDWSLK